jgi:hypothetical protein
MSSTECFRPDPPPLPRLPGVDPQTFPAKQWTKVLEWNGFTVQTLVYRVALAPAASVVKWRRHNGGITREGSFSGTLDLNIHPKDKNLVIELWVDDDGVTVALEPIGAVAL